jgi:hypothetical protein
MYFVMFSFSLLGPLNAASDWHLSEENGNNG